MNSLAQSASLKDLPNLPGYRKNEVTGRRNKKPTSQASLMGGTSPTRGTRFDDASIAEQSMGDDAFSLASYFEDPEKFKDMKEFNKSIQAFPSESGAYNDVSGRYSLRSQLRDRVTRTRALPYSTLDEAPHFVANSKAPVCRVLAYFMEAAPMNLVEPERARKVEIIFHLEDNTIEIIEPYIPNCGIMQGKMLKRHKVPKPIQYKKRGVGEQPIIGTGEGVDTEHFSITDVHAGAKLMIYQREYTVIDCDSSTKRLLHEYGTPFGAVIPTPSSVYDPRILQSAALIARKAQVGRCQHILSIHSINTSYHFILSAVKISTPSHPFYSIHSPYPLSLPPLNTPSQPTPSTHFLPLPLPPLSHYPPHQVGMRNTKKSTGFFEYDRKVLRFYGMWDSRDRLFGDELKVGLSTHPSYISYQHTLTYTS